QREDKKGKNKSSDESSRKSKSKETISQSEDEGSVTDEVRNADYYHGLIPKTDAEALLKKDGDFLLRKTEHSSGVIIHCISVKTEDKVKHFDGNRDHQHFFYITQAHKEKSVPALIIWYKTNKTPLSPNSKAVLKKPIERPPWTLNHDAIFILKKLGQGAFGEVYQAEYVSKSTEKVAVKTMRGEVTRDARNKFKEARMMRKYDHKHVVRIFGMAVHEHPLMIVMVRGSGGSLLSFIKKHGKTCGLAEKLRFATESADGLAYLSKQQCVHRDIAARNVLLTDKNVVKISDFGMSDDKVILHDDTLEKVPVKWLAPETMQEKIYSLKSDVWSYGIMVWEIYANGAEPYPGMTRMVARAKIVVADYRMEMPKDTPAEVTKLVAQCWDKVPEKRPDMATVFS
ncbi:hypothetical protein PENTCL1PPCAC_27103, partial [Pristionchus entomophagus]